MRSERNEMESPAPSPTSNPSVGTLLMILSVPLIAIGYKRDSDAFDSEGARTGSVYRIGVFLLVLGIVLSLLQTSSDPQKKTKEQRSELRYDVMTPHDLVLQLQAIAAIAMERTRKSPSSPFKDGAAEEEEKKKDHEYEGHDVKKKKKDTGKSSSSSDDDDKTKGQEDKNDENDAQDEQKTSMDTAPSAPCTPKNAHFLTNELIQLRCVRAIQALSAKYGLFLKEHRKQQKRNRKNSGSDAGGGEEDPGGEQDHHGRIPAWMNKMVDPLALDDFQCLCQNAVHVVLNPLIPLLAENDQVVSSSLSLLAIVADSTAVRQRYQDFIGGDDAASPFGTTTDQEDLTKPLDVDFPLVAIQQSLQRSREAEEEEEDDEVVVPDDKDGLKDEENKKENWQREQLAAEVQRRGCLFIGALCNGSSEISTLLVEKHKAMDILLSAIEWYRYHSDVGTWALWALFNMCYDNADTKHALLRKGGVLRICQFLQNLARDGSLTLEVTRHGVAILFDGVRDVLVSQKTSPQDMATMRSVAVNAGLHEFLLQAMQTYAESSDIVSMGRELLLSTGYQGELPAAMTVAMMPS